MHLLRDNVVEMESVRLRWGKIVDTHPEDHSVDLIMLDDGSHMIGVPVLTPVGGTNFGLAAMVQPPITEQPGVAREDAKWNIEEHPEREIRAAVLYFFRMPVVIGFQFPQINQMTFDRLNFHLNRHPSDVYSTIDNEGNIEVAHPSGTFIRIGTTAAHEDLTGRDFDGLWAIRNNRTTAVHLNVSVSNAGAHRASLHIAPDGAVTIRTVGTLSLHSDGAATITAPSLTINAPVAVTGATLTHQGVNVGAAHTHGGVMPGEARTAGPG